MREVPLSAARLLGLYAAHFKFVPAAYLAFMFLLVPGVCLGIAAVFGASIAGGMVLLLLVLVPVAVFVKAWTIGIPAGNALCYKVLSHEAREQGQHDLARANAEVLGEVPERQG